MYLGDVRLGVTLDFKFTTRSFATGAPTTLAGSPVISAYVDNGTTEITAGVTLSVDFDSRTGLNNVRVVLTSGNGYAAGTNIDFVITTGTVGGVSVVGEVVGQVSIENRSALMPTTAGRTLDVSAGGEGGIDWANIGSPTTAQNLSATNIDPDQVVASVTAIVTANVTQIDGNATNGYNATLKLKKLDINNDAGDALSAVSSGSNGHGAVLVGHGSGMGLQAAGGANGHGVQGVGGSTSGHGIFGYVPAGSTFGSGLAAQCDGDDGDGITAKGANGSGVSFESLAGDWPGMQVVSAEGNGAQFTGSATTGGSGVVINGRGTGRPGLLINSAEDDAIRAVAGGGGAGLSAQGGATGNGITATAGGGDAQGLLATGAGTGAGVQGQSAGSGPGLAVYGSGTSAALHCEALGSGKSILAAVESGADLVESLRLANAANAGKLSGAATTNVKIRDLADTLDRIDATVDANGNRTAVTRDVS